MSYRSPVILSILSATLFCATNPLCAQNRTSGYAAPPKCAVSVPNEAGPPEVFTHREKNDNGGDNSTSYGNYGNRKLSTTLWLNGTVEFRPGGPGFVEWDGARSMKWPWWRGTPGKLTIEGKRLDGSAPPLRASIPDGYGDIGFQSTALIFSTAGCWEVTGKVGMPA